MSVRNREPVYRENTNTIMNLLADFQGYQYSLTKIEGFTVHLTDKVTTISIPKNMYSTVSSLSLCFTVVRFSHWGLCFTQL